MATQFDLQTMRKYSELTNVDGFREGALLALAMLAQQLSIEDIGSLSQDDQTKFAAIAGLNYREVADAYQFITTACRAFARLQHFAEHHPDQLVNGVQHGVAIELQEAC